MWIRSILSVDETLNVWHVTVETINLKSSSCEVYFKYSHIVFFIST